MPGMMENLSTINSFLRTLIALAAIGAVSVVSYFGYAKFNSSTIEAETRAREPRRISTRAPTSRKKKKRKYFVRINYEPLFLNAL